MSSSPAKIRKLLPERKRGWIRFLSDRDRIRVEFTVRGKNVTVIDVIQYEAEMAGTWVGIVRFDMAHGFLHRDIMRPDGAQEKFQVPYRTLAEAVTGALDYIEEHWEFYRMVYEEKTR
jgi:hypothetical protein